MKYRAGLLAIGTISCLFGCKASLSGDARVDGSAEASGDGEVRDFDQPMPAGASAELASASMDTRVLLGARHDLKLDPSGGTATCECLAVGLGGARSSGLRWSGPPPALDDSSQLVIALTSEGSSCKNEPKGSLGASYWGYKISGNDVIVLVEEARGGRPLTSGAVIPRPVGAGQVFVAPASKKLPYGRALEGKGLCKIGNPGTPRSVGFSVLELGEDAPPARGSVP